MKAVGQILQVSWTSREINDWVLQGKPAYQGICYQAQRPEGCVIFVTSWGITASKKIQFKEIYPKPGREENEK